ncbi:MAG: hypothetical protein GY940_05675, partial [bacterium]|nr:hypothetical protein [bacterium]
MIKNTNTLKIAARQRVKEKKYWLEKLSGMKGISHFPYDYDKRENLQSHEKREVETYTMVLPGDLRSQLIKLSKGDDRALHVILCAGFIITLHRYTDQGNITIGTPIYTQENSDGFLNTLLPLRTDPTSAGTFKEFLLSVKKTIIEALGHYNYPLAMLTQPLGLSGQDETGPLFDTLLLLDNIQKPEYLKGARLNMLFRFSRSAGAIA